MQGEEKKEEQKEEQKPMEEDPTDINSAI